MTLAIGMICQGGILVTADTRVSYDDGSVADVEKVSGFASHSGLYAIAQSSHDANAANSLIAELEGKLAGARPSSSQPSYFSEVEQVIKEVLRQWYAPVYENRPSVQLLVGVVLEQEKTPALYFCEPPSTVCRIWDAYKAIGAGWVISDPIYKYWTQGGVRPLHETLCEASYLMYKGKQLLPASIGGFTDAIFIGSNASALYRVERKSMATAEACGPAFDRAMSKIVSLAMSGGAGGTPETLKIAEFMYSISLLYSRLELHCSFPEITIRHEFNT